MKITNYDICPGSIIVVKYPNDEVVVGEVTTINQDNRIVLKNPCKVIDIPDPNSNSILTIIKLWNRFSLDSTSEINLNNISGISLANKHIIDGRNMFLRNQILENVPKEQSERREDLFEYYKSSNSYNYHESNNTIN